MLTIKQLKELIKDVDDETVIVLVTQPEEEYRQCFYFVDDTQLDNKTYIRDQFCLISHSIPFDSADVIYDTEDDCTDEFGCD